jgi:hypothetical protein
MNETRFYCRYCGATFRTPERVVVPDDPFALNTVYELCEKCGSMQIEEMEECPTCDYGWKRTGQNVCEKCHLRAEGEIRLFARRFRKELLYEMDSIIEGESLANFQ